MVAKRVNDLTESTGRKHTIRDVARLADVSIKTVSRVLNDEPAVKDETRKRVMRVIHELGYQPHSGARSMRGHCRNCIGITLGAPIEVVPLSEQLLLWLFTQLYYVFGSRGNYVCFDLNPYQAGKNSDYARGLWEQLYGGIVITGPLATGDPIIRKVHDSGYPYLAISRVGDLPECSSATVDFERAAYISTKHLIDRGHRHIALLKGFHGYHPSEERKRGYLRALQEAGIEPDTRLIANISFTSGELSRLVHDLLSDHKVTAVVDSSGTEDGKSLREGAKHVNRTIGRDVEFVVWTYTDNSAVLTEACAHVWLPLHEAIQEGLNQLADWFNGKRVGPVQVLHTPVLYEEVKFGEVPIPKHILAVPE